MRRPRQVDAQPNARLAQLNRHSPNLTLNSYSVLHKMCYSVYLSTDFEGDLSPHSGTLIRFEKDFSSREPQIVDLLLYKYPWYVGSKAGCGCTFRHLSSIELGFGEPVDWYAEQPDEIEATGLFYDVVSGLVSAGHAVDCIEIWAGATPDRIQRLAVDLASISREAFRFFENHHFVFTPTGTHT